MMQNRMMLLLFVNLETEPKAATTTYMAITVVDKSTQADVNSTSAGHTVPTAGLCQSTTKRAHCGV